MNYTIYKIKGKHSETKRVRTLKLNAFSEDDAIQQALASGLESCTSIEIVPFDKPTQNQLDYARDLGIQKPEGFSKEDVSALISKKVDEDDDCERGLMEFATTHNIYVSKYIGTTALYGQIFSSLSITDRIAFFIYAIYRDITGDVHSNLDTHPARTKFYQFASTMENDNQYIKSLERYSSGKEVRHFGEITIRKGLEESSIFGGSTDTIAYKNSRQFLINQGLVSETSPYKKRTVQMFSTEPVTVNTTNHVSPPPVQIAKGKGCGSAAALFLVISSIFGGMYLL